LKPVGKLHLETHPDNLEEFSTLLDKLKEISKGIYFIATDVAFDIPISQNNVFVSSNTGRAMNIFKGTRYFGGKGQRGKHGYCRIYDKKQESLKRRLITGELTRIEIVYRSTEKFELKELTLNPPSFNKLYAGRIINIDKGISPIYKSILFSLQEGLMTIDQFTRHYRRVLKKQLNSSEVIDFDELIRKEWFKQVVKINSLVL